MPYGTDQLGSDDWADEDGIVSAGTDGARLLDDVRAFLARFVAFPSAESLSAATLWAAHTHCLDAFDCTPRLALLSPEPGSGKTRALEILELLVLRPLLTVNVTPAYLFRKVADEAGPPTLLYDEIDTVFGPRAKDNEDIRGMLNAGYRRGATAGRCVIRGKTVEVEELPAYAAVALAGLDDLPDTIMSRCIIVRMRRRAPHEHVDSYRRRLHEAEGYALRDRLAAWATEHHEKLLDAWPTLPAGIEDRNADVWEPLLAIAEAAGGEWVERARCDAVTLVTAARAKGGSFGTRLLADLRTIFRRSGEEKLTTDTILTELHGIDEAPWGDLRGKPLDARNLARRLEKYEVKPKSVRVGDRNAKGYDRGDLVDVWSRYLPAETADDDEQDEQPPVVTAEEANSTKSDPTHPEGTAQAVTAARPLAAAAVTAVTPSQTEHCTVCGHALWDPRSQARGLCAGCAMGGAA